MKTILHIKQWHSTLEVARSAFEKKRLPAPRLRQSDLLKYDVEYLSFCRILMMIPYMHNKLENF